MEGGGGKGNKWIDLTKTKKKSKRHFLALCVKERYQQKSNFIIIFACKRRIFVSAALDSSAR